MTLPPDIRWLLEQDAFVVFWACWVITFLLLASDRPHWSEKRRRK